MAKKTISLNEGAEMERKAWMAKVKRERQHVEPDPVGRSLCDNLLQWGAGRKERNAKKAGGLGKR